MNEAQVGRKNQSPARLSKNHNSQWHNKQKRNWFLFSDQVNNMKQPQKPE